MSQTPYTTQGPSLERRAFFALMLAGTAMGVSPILIRLADVSAMASGFWRLAIALPIVAVMLPEPKRAPPSSADPRRDMLLLTFAGLMFAVDIVCWHAAIALTTVADATLLSNGAPIFVTAAAFVFLGERISRRFAMGLALAIAGSVALVVTRAKGVHGPVDRLAGDLFAVGAAMSYAAYLLILRSLRQRITTRRIIVHTTAISALAMLPVALFAPGAFLPGSLAGWATVIALAAICHAGGQGLLTFALAHLPASYSSTTQLIAAVVAALAAWALLGEPIGLLTFLCGVAIMTGLWICHSAPRG
ncbi:MAG: DMT family transporter [Hyphomicrobiales bacterium]